jgi:hypothetical protein
MWPETAVIFPKCCLYLHASSDEEPSEQYGKSNYVGQLFNPKVTHLVLLNLNFSINSLVKSELIHCNPKGIWICCSQLAKGVSLTGLLPVPVVAFVTC